MTDRNDSLPGKRFDNGKPQVHLVAPSLMLAVATVATFGAKKYGPRNWEAGMPMSRIYSPMMRHLLKWWSGEDLDEESGLPHSYHIAWNAQAIVEYERRIQEGTLPSEVDDRPHRAVIPEPAPRKVGDDTIAALAARYRYLLRHEMYREAVHYEAALVALGCNPESLARDEKAEVDKMRAKDMLVMPPGDLDEDGRGVLNEGTEGTPRPGIARKD